MPSRKQSGVFGVKINAVTKWVVDLCCLSYTCPLPPLLMTSLLYDKVEADSAVVRCVYSIYIMCVILSRFNPVLCDCALYRRERSKVPLIVRQCVEEIERRGMEEVGIYRVSGVATDIQALKAAFDSSEFTLNLLNKDRWRRRNTLDVKMNVRKEPWKTNLYPALRFLHSLVFIDCCVICLADNKDVSLMMREMDVNAIAGTLKLYFRELPEPLFTDELYPNFAGGIG